LRAFDAAINQNRHDPEATWGRAWALWTNGAKGDASVAFKHAIRCSLHTSVVELIPLIPAHDTLTGLTRLLATALLDAERLIEAETVATEPSLIIRIMVAGARYEEALQHESAKSVTCGLALRALIHSALTMSRTDDALNFAMRLDEPERTRAIAEVHSAAGQYAEALRVRRGESATMLPETASEIERLCRAIDREGLLHFGSETLPESGPARLLALRYRARLLATEGKLNEVRTLLTDDPENAELLEELLPTATGQTPRGYLAAVLSGLRPTGPTPSGIAGAAARLLLQSTAPSPRNLRRLRRLISKAPEDVLLSTALQQLIQKEATA
jgi:hypothetical protein